MEENQRLLRGKQGTWRKDVKEQVFVGNEEITSKRIGEKEDIILRTCSRSVFRRINRGISKYPWICSSGDLSSGDVELTKQS